MRLVLIVLAICCAAVVSGFTPWLNGNTPLACPQGFSLPDGCPGANPNSAFQQPTAFQSSGLFNTLAGTTTNYSSTRITANAAGVDYPVGAYTPVASMADPLVGLEALGCTQTTTNPAGNPILTCGSGFTANRIGEYDFKARFGHPCVILNVNGSAAPTGGVLTITDNNFENDGSCGFAHGQDYLIAVGDLSYETDIKFNTFNGHGTTFKYSDCGNVGFPGTNPCNAVSAMSSGGVNVVEYNSFIDFAGRTLYCNITGTNPAVNGYTFKYNYLQGWDYYPFNGHTEFVVCNGNTNIATEDYEYNTIVNTTDAMQFGPSPIFPASTFSVAPGSIKIIGNTIIPSFVGGSTYSATVSGCVGATSACSSPGSNFYASSVSGTDRIGHGEELGGSNGGAQCTTPSGSMTVTSITAPTGVTSTVTITADSPALIVGNTITMPAPSGYGTVAMTILSIPTGGGAGSYLVTNPNTGTFSGTATATTTSGTATVTAISQPTGSSTLTVTGSPTIGLQPGYTITMSSGYGTNAMTITNLLSGTSNILGGAGTYTVTNPNSGSFSGSATATTPGGLIFAWIGTNLGGGTGSGSSWTISTNFNPPGNILLGPATCTGLSMFGPSSATAVAQMNFFSTVGSITITGNYMDSNPTFVQHGAGIFTLGGTSSFPMTCSIPSVISGNVDMAGLAGSTVINPSFSSAPFTTGC